MIVHVPTTINPNPARRRLVRRSCSAQSRRASAGEYARSGRGAIISPISPNRAVTPTAAVPACPLSVASQA
jgi:hypothetical protein